MWEKERIGEEVREMREKDSENGHRCGDGTSKEDEKGSRCEREGGGGREGDRKWEKERECARGREERLVNRQTMFRFEARTETQLF